MAACLGQKECEFMTSIESVGESVCDDGKSVGRRFSIRVNIFELAKTEFFSVSYACFLALLYAHDTIVQCISWNFYRFPYSLEQKACTLVTMTLWER